MTDFTLSL